MRQLPLKKDDHVSDPPSKIDNRWHYPYVRISGASINVETAAEGRYSDYFISASGDVSNHIFEFSALNPIATVTDNEKYVYGRNLLSTLSSAATSGSFSAAVARATANVDGKVSTANFKAYTSGIDDAHWEEMRKVAKKIDAGSMQQLGRAVGQALTWCVTEAKTGVKEPDGIFLLKDIDWDTTKSFVFALNRISRGDSSLEANEFLNDKLGKGRTREKYMQIDPLTIAAVYHRLDIEQEKEPTNEQKRLAKDVLKGRVPMPAKNNTVTGYWYEVGPYQMDDGSIPALARLTADPKRVTVNKWPIKPEDLSPSKGEIGSFKVDVQTAIQVSSSGLVDLDSKLDAQFHGYGFISSYLVEGVADTIILDEKYAVGFKVRTRTTDMDANLDVPTLAGKASLGISDMSYEIDALGINLGGLNFIPGFSSSAIGKFDLNTLNALGALYNEASSILSDHSDDNFKPVLTAVKLNLGSNEVQGLVEEGVESLEKIRLEASKMNNRGSNDLDLASIDSGLFTTGA